MARHLTVTDIRPGQIVGRPGKDERVIVIGVNPPTVIEDRGQTVTRHLVAVAFADGIGYLIPLTDRDHLIRYPSSTPVSPGPHSPDLDSVSAAASHKY